MRIITERLTITDFTPDMAGPVHRGSLDAATRRFLPDEVFETEEIAAAVLHDLIDCYGSAEGPYVHPMLLHDGTFVGYIQLVQVEGGRWEVGYHVSEAHRGHGYATEGLTAFLPEILHRMSLRDAAGICLAENTASVRVLEKCGFRRVFAGDGPYQGTVQPIVEMVYTLRA